MRHHRTHARLLAPTRTHTSTSSSSSSFLPHTRRYDDSLGCFCHATHSNELQAYSATNSRDSPSITHDRLGSRKHERHGWSPWSYAPHSAQQVHESACSLGPLPIVMSILAAARYSSSTVLLFLPRKTLSDEEQSQMMRGERVYQADGTRTRRTCSLVLSCSLVSFISRALQCKIEQDMRTNTHTHTHNDGGRTLKRRQLTIRCVATCAYVCVCAMSSGTKPLSLLDRLQQRRSAIYLSVRRISCASHIAAEEYVCIFSLSLLYPLSYVSRMCLCCLCL